MVHDVDPVLHRHVLGVLTDLDADAVRPERTLSDLGANSLDRIDIIGRTLDELGLEIGPEELGQASDLRQLTTLLRKHTTRS